MEPEVEGFSFFWGTCSVLSAHQLLSLCRQGWGAALPARAVAFLLERLPISCEEQGRLRASSHWKGGGQALLLSPRLLPCAVGY